MLRRMLAAIPLARAIVSTREALAQGLIDEARERLARVGRLYGFDLPSPVALIEANLLAAQVFIAAHEGPSALAAAEAALRQLSEGRERYRPADRAYLKAYAEGLVAYCERWRDRSPAVRRVHVPEGDDVSAGLRRNFPIPRSGALDLDLDDVRPWRP